MNIVIVGAGIGGLSLALSLHNNNFGDQITILEAAQSIRPLGVGINLPPHATRELCELGLGGELAAVGIETSHLSYFDRSGNELWTEPRGKNAGYNWPQYSIHRGTLQMILLEAVQKRLGEGCVHTGCKVSAVTSGSDGAEVTYLKNGTEKRLAADLIVGADGIKSVVRDSCRGKVTDLSWNGWVMHRGTTRSMPFLDGQTMVIVGDEKLRVVVYPIEKPDEGRGTLQNWLLSCKAIESDALDLGNWNRPCQPKELAKMISGWNFEWLNIENLINSAREGYVYPMADFNPLPKWTFGRTTLLGDAAHAMYPFGSNGASQAIIDARFLAYLMATQEIDAALAEYEGERLPATSAVQLANRRQADEVMTRVSQLARNETLASARAELVAREREYKRLAGFDMADLNARPSWNVS